MKKLVRACMLFLFVGALVSAAPGAVILKIKVASANLWLKPDLNSSVVDQLPGGLILESEQKTGSFYSARLTEEGKGTVSGYLGDSAVEVICSTEGLASVPLAEALILRVKIASANVWKEADPNSPVVGRLAVGQLLEVRQWGYTFLGVTHVTAGGQIMQGYVHRAAVEGVCRGQEPIETLPSAVLTVRVQRANVWSEPDINSPILGDLRMGDRLEVIRKVRTYYEVRFRAISGVYTGYVQETALGESPKESAPPPRRLEAKAERRRSFPLIEVGGYYPISNNYRRGGVDDWWKTLTGEAAAQGSAAFFMLEGAAYFPLRTDRFCLGAAASFHIPMPHAIWGSRISEEGMREVTIKPGLISLGLSLRFFPLSSRTLSVTAAPSLLFGWANGAYFNSDAAGTIQEDFSSRMKMGMGIGAGIEYAFLKNLAVSVRAELRALTVALALESSKEKIATLDLGGSAVLIGLAVRL